jgi:hypothetical protein
MTGDAQLLEMIRRVEKLGSEGITEMAKAAAPKIEEISKASAAAGTTPDGQAWKPKKDGKAPLQNAAAAVECVPLFDKIKIRLIGTATGSQKVQAIQNLYRPIIPTRGGEVPKPLVEALKDAASKTFKRIMGGG